MNYVNRAFGSEKFRISHSYLLFKKARAVSGPLILLCLIVFVSCKKFVEVEAPTTTTNSELVFKSDGSAIAALTNIYTLMSQQGVGSGITSVSLYCGLSADELRFFPASSDQTIKVYYTNSLTSLNTNNNDFWVSIYSSPIFLTNSAIFGLTNSSELTPKVRDHLLGEALFLRAFCYFYLVNMYGDVPLVLTTDYRSNSSIPRTKRFEVYEQIVADLKESQRLLDDKYSNSSLTGESDDRIVPNKYSATSLLARVYLYVSDWTNAEKEASKVIEYKELYDTVPVPEAFLVNNKESIWQLKSVSNFNTNTSDALEFLSAKTFIPAARVYLNENIPKSFEINDKRRRYWIDSVEADNTKYYLPSKYKIITPLEPPTERTVILRLSEQYLIRAEARAQLGLIESALDDLNVIRMKAGISSLQLMSKGEFLNKLTDERRHELFTEWGHRWFDLKRMGIATSVLDSKEGASWQNNDTLYPIPYSEIQLNTALQGHQNPGY
jgi:hypothetical protein